ncbi:RsmB/NOP family class I SAM-dependent RNA methyltransferase [Horticoccus sp. 23ND18S-11]|uniref:RsmB/NOP family class I SAM-dependent RNA methyltransferase n=1 Tax=Horticoccus sp. 23ND18S-11 TaxID=3391832 RepID=UPI0039C93637
MPDQATLNHAAQVLAQISSDQRADTALRFYFEHHRYLQPPARRAISHTVFAYFRWLSWLDPKLSPQKRLEQAFSMHERNLADEKSVKAETLAVRAVPAWIATEMDLPADYLRQIQREPALWLRARPGRGADLAKSLFAAEATDHAPDALRFTGTQDLFKTEQFKTGEFEIQDLASQLVSHAAAPKPGETWWDACAGEGGKTLHLADLMGNKGTVWASDRHTRRLDTLKRRAARAKIFNYRVAAWETPEKLPTKTKFDGILVDAPCSGVGTWQRNPHARWTTTPADVAELAGVQLALLNQVVGSLKPGGRIIYAVCTLTRSETNAVADAFSAAHPELVPLDLTASRLQPATPRLTLWPHALNANGMFIAGWKRTK